MTEHDLTLMFEECETEIGVYAIEMSSLRLVWTKYESYIINAGNLMHLMTDVYSEHLDIWI